MLVALDDAPDVVALIPTLGEDQPRLERCLASLAAQGETRLAVLVVSNGTVALELPAPASVVVAGVNLGWAGGLRLARGLVEAPLLWLVQDDLEPQPGCLDALRAALDRDPRLGLVTPLVVGADGLVPTHACGGVLAEGAPAPLPVPLDPTSPELLPPLDTLSYVPSRGMLVRTEDWDAVGGMDPRFYPALWADVDLCRAFTANDRGFALELTALARHQMSGSTPGAYGRFLAGWNGEVFWRKWHDGEPSPTAGEAVPPELVSTIAASAAATLRGFAGHHVEVSAELDEQRRGREAEYRIREALIAEIARRDRELAAMRATKSWRVTAPLRAVVRVAGRARARLRGR